MTATEFSLSHPVGVAISSALRESELLSTYPEAAASKKDMRNGWVWYSLPPFTDGAVVVGMSLCFNNGILELVTVSDSHPRFGVGWAEWSEAKERARADSIGAWLSRNGLSVGTYSWGGIWVGYDSKGGFGSASVQYAAQQGVQRDGFAAR